MCPLYENSMSAADQTVSKSFLGDRLGVDELTGEAALLVQVPKVAHVVDDERVVLDRRLEALLAVPGHVSTGAVSHPSSSIHMKRLTG